MMSTKKQNRPVAARAAGYGGGSPIRDSTTDIIAARGEKGKTLEAALLYARHGWYVLPLHSVRDSRCTCKNADNCESPGKHPRWDPLLCPDGVHSATSDPDLIKRMWAEWPDANVGIATGAKTGFFVLDVDPRHGGDESLAELVARHGELPDTVESLTGGGGRHIFFAHPGHRIPNKANIAPGMDIRGDGGYIVAPPSVHISGNHYEWEISSRPDEVTIAPAPSWLLALIGVSERGNGRGLATTISDRIPAGERNSTLTSLAGTMRRRGMSEEAIFAALWTENLARCDPPLDEDEVRRIAKSVARYRPEVERPNLTDLGNAMRLVDRHGEELRYCHPWRRWLVWDGRRWRIDEDGEIVRRAVDVRQGIYAEAAALSAEAANTVDDSKRKELASKAQATLTWAKGSESRVRINAMIELAQSLPGIPVAPDELDAAPWLLNVQNGTLDLRTGELRPHRREDMLTKLAPVAYDPEAECPTWLSFLARIFDGNENLIAFMQRALGYALTGDVSEQVLFICYGVGANGKSTLLNTVRAVLGEDYARHTPTETLLIRERGGGIPNDIARLKGARFVTAIEADAGRRLAESLIKQITGGDPVAARFMRAEWFEYVPEWKLFLAVNHKPMIRGTDNAIWRRIRLIPFTVTIPEPEQDKHLGEKLLAEAPGILAWMVRGCLDWQAKGLGTPEEVKAATAEYRDEMDILGDFLSERCIQSPAVEATAKELYDEYVQWCEENNVRPLGKVRFGIHLQERGFTRARGHGGTRKWRGVGLLAEEGEL